MAVMSDGQGEMKRYGSKREKREREKKREKRCRRWAGKEIKRCGKCKD